MSGPENTLIIEMRDVSIGAIRDIGFIVLEDVNWSVAPGEFWAIAGQQHSGKSDFADAGRRTDGAGQRRLQTLRDGNADAQ